MKLRVFSRLGLAGVMACGLGATFLPSGAQAAESKSFAISGSQDWSTAEAAPESREQGGSSAATGTATVHQEAHEQAMAAGFTAAPLPDDSVDEPTARDAHPEDAEIRPDFFRQKAPVSGDGFSAGSTANTHRRGGAPSSAGVDVAFPL